MKFSLTPTVLNLDKKIAAPFLTLTTILIVHNQMTDEGLFTAESVWAIVTLVKVKLIALGIWQCVRNTVSAIVTVLDWIFGIRKLADWKEQSKEQLTCRSNIWKSLETKRTLFSIFVLISEINSTAVSNREFFAVTSQYMINLLWFSYCFKV